MIVFMDHNPDFELYDFSYIAHIPNIAANDNMVAINTILSIDLLGQACVDHIGVMPFGGVGGQTEFCIGSHYSKGGRSISCLIAEQGGVSRIVPEFEAGTGIAIPMHYVDYLVTEYGVVNLEYKSRRERAEAIISVAHPDFRAELMKAAQKRFGM